MKINNKIKNFHPKINFSEKNSISDFWELKNDVKNLQSEQALKHVRNEMNEGKCYVTTSRVDSELSENKIRKWDCKESSHAMTTETGEKGQKERKVRKMRRNIKDTIVVWIVREIKNSTWNEILFFLCFPFFLLS